MFQTLPRSVSFSDTEPRVDVYNDSDSSKPVLSVTGWKDVAEVLEPKGVRFERWNPNKPLSADPSEDEVLTAYKDDVDRINKAYGFVKNDVIGIWEGNRLWDKREMLRKKFLDEHFHTEPEVRFFIRGAAQFNLHMGKEVVSMVCPKDALLGVPERTPHWFDMGEFPDFLAIRFFGTSEGWVVNHTGDKIADKFPRYPTTEDANCSRPRKKSKTE